MATDPNFEYTIDRMRTRFSKPEIAESLQRYAKTHGVETFGMRDYDKWDQHILSSARILVAFGSWGKALQAAGLRAERSYGLDLKEMVVAFKACWRQHGSAPSKRQLETYLDQHKYPFRWSSYKGVWGGLGCLATLIVKAEKGLISPNELHQRRSNQSIRHPISLKLRIAVLKRDKYRCVKCGASPKVDKRVRLQVDHILPVAKHGSNSLDNLQTLCFDCNQGKKDADD
jgi:hypothetical protein